MRRRHVLRLTLVALASGCTATPAISTPTATVTATTVATSAPAQAPTLAPTVVPTVEPTKLPTLPPTQAPTAVPTRATPTALEAAVDAAMQRGIDTGVTPGGVVLVRHSSVQLMLKAYGLARKYDAPSQLSDDPIPASTDTLYDLASITKLFTTTALMRLVEQGRLALDEPVATWVPEFGKHSVTVRHLLTHSSGLPDYLKLWELEPTPEARMQRVLATPLLNPPGSVYRYSDLGLIAIGHLLERLSGRPLAALVTGSVIAPLGLAQTLYRPRIELRPRIAATEDESEIGRGMLWGEVDDANCWSLGGVAGHAGLFGTAADLARLAQLYLDAGTLDGVQLLRPETVNEMTRNQIATLGWRGLGWELNAKYYMGDLTGPGTYGHTGFTGTSVVINPQRQLIVVLLTNRVHPTPDGPSIIPVRQAVANACRAFADSA